MIQMEISFMIWGMTDSIRRMWICSWTGWRQKQGMYGLMFILIVTGTFLFWAVEFMSSIIRAR